jgi:hypothetical protein
MNRIEQGCAAGFLAWLALAAVPAAQAVPMDEVVLQGLDKITARVSTIKVPVGTTVSFGALQITARACDKHPPEETPESAAFLEVVENKPDESPVKRFSGWMFASSPALSGLEHPIYDLVVLDCVNDDPSRSEAPAGTAPDEKSVNQQPAPSNSSSAPSGTSE